MAQLNAVTYNLGCGGPYSSARVEAAHAWSVRARERYDLVFAQEVPSDEWLNTWSSTHYVNAVANPRYRVRSVFLVGRTLSCSPVQFATAHYHDSYVAAATVTFPDRRNVICASVHASPEVVTDEWRRLWEECGQTVPAPREGAELWDSDMLLASIAEMSREGSLLVAGDWNEARAWDDTHSGTSGAQFFERFQDHHLVDCTWQSWNCERPTCIPSVGVSLQVDHVIATPDIAASVEDPRILSEGPDAGGSDHFPIVFTINLDGLN